MKRIVIDVNVDKKCSRCGKGGAMPSGLCMKCAAKAIKNGELDHILHKPTEGHP